MNDGLLAEADAAQARALTDDLDRRIGTVCVGCPQKLCGHAVLSSIALGLKDAPRCLACLARGLDEPAAELRDRLRRHLLQRACFRQAWETATRRELSAPPDLPACPWTAREATGASLPTFTAIPPSTESEAPSATWDAGTMGCGELVLALRGKLLALPPGAVLRVVAHDTAAPEDLPAWCRLTGHPLVRASHPTYDIRRKGENPCPANSASA